MKDNEIKVIDGINWPVADVICRPYTLAEIRHPEIISKQFCKKTRNVIQAGGNVGLYAKEYSKFFNNVYTFEPEYLNFKCLNLNATEKNIFKYQCCLGFNSDPVKLNISDYLNSRWKIREHTKGKVIDTLEGANVGGYSVDGVGNIPVIEIDSLKLLDLDLIHLDIEGFEGFAIQGAMKSINKYKPIIVLELGFNHGEKYQFGSEKVITLLESMSYKMVDTLGQDFIFEYQ